LEPHHPTHNNRAARKEEAREKQKQQKHITTQLNKQAKNSHFYHQETLFSHNYN